jgi:hypothetical protein
MLLSDDTAERDAFRHLLVCVVDLAQAVPSLTAARKDRLIWYGGQLTGQEFSVAHQTWRDTFVLVGDDADFARAVVSEDHAARCLQIDAKAEWRFKDDDFLLWIENAQVGDELTTALDVMQPLIDAAEAFPSLRHDK